MIALVDLATAGSLAFACRILAPDWGMGRWGTHRDLEIYDLTSVSIINETGRLGCFQFAKQALPIPLSPQLPIPHWGVASVTAPADFPR
jgi:hypothetical protein